MPQKRIFGFRSAEDFFSADDQNAVIITTPELERAIEAEEIEKRRKFAELFNKQQMKEGPVCELCGRRIIAPTASNRKVSSSRRKYCSRACQTRSAQRRTRARLNLDTARRRLAKSLRLSDPLYFS
jgi:hypothetical protein